jgi:hypothetical protein
MPHDVGGLGQETGWLSKWAFQFGALSKDTIGRQAVEDGYITLQMLDDTTVLASHICFYDLGLYDASVYK